MCGIAGVWGDFSSELLAMASRRQAHRGPDDHGLFEDSASGVALAHVRLTILELSSLGHQPMVSNDGSVVLVFNGEIYNFRELRKELAAAGHTFRGHSDTEVLLALYMRYGQEMLGHLNGIFAFAIYDRRRAEMFLARDALGVKPLYYCESGSGFAFASELKALLSLVPDTRTLDHAALHRYLTFLWCPGSGTPLRGVRKVMPGEALVLRNRRISRRWQWYHLPAFRGVAPDLGERTAIEGIANALRVAVHRQLVADVPVGAFLSGGLDSSAVVAMARERAPGIRCFTIEARGGSDPGEVEDLPYARRVARHLQVPLEVVQIDSARMATDIENMVYLLDEPLADPASLNVLYISKLARERGIKVLLSGAGGDDLFSGYRRHLAVKYESFWSWLPSGLRRGLAGLASGYDQRRARSRRIAKWLSGIELNGAARTVNYFVWSREPELMSLYTDDLRAELQHQSAAAPMVEFLAALPDSVSPLERILALEQRFFLADHNLLYTDKMSMAAGVEVRVPFLDHDVVEFAARVPTRIKHHGRAGKWVLKKAMEPYLPQDVIYRSKTGFGAPLRRWMRCELRALLGDVLSEDALRRRGLFDPAAVRRLMRCNDAGEVDGAYTLLSLLCIELWCRRFADISSSKAAGEPWQAKAM